MARIIFSGDSDALKAGVARPQVRKDPSRDCGAAHTTSQRKKTQATAKLQIYWSGNKYKHLIKKLLWRDFTQVSCLDSATPALTPDLSAQVGRKPPGGTGRKLSHCPSSYLEALTTSFYQL